MKNEGYKILGYISKKVGIEHEKIEQIGKAIKMTPHLLEHVAPHIPEFINVESYLFTLSHLTDVLNNPDMTYYNKRNNSIEYYKMLQENVCVVVKLSNKNNLFLASFYPVKQTKIKNRADRKSWEEYVLTEEEAKEKIDCGIK